MVADHRGLEPTAAPQLDDDAVQRGAHAARTPELRELDGLSEAPPHQLARRAEDPPVDQLVTH
jgi:hypothetical protein